MRFGAVFPQTEIGPIPSPFEISLKPPRRSATITCSVFDHVTGVNAERADWDGLYTHRHMFHEVLTLLAYLAGVTSRIELATGILILPQRQTVLVAKQAAEVDVLSGAACGSASASAGAPSSMRRWARTSTTADAAPRSKSPSCGPCGPRTS